MEDMKIMKRYKVYVYNTVDKFWDCYEVLAEDPVDARRSTTPQPSAWHTGYRLSALGETQKSGSVQPCTERMFKVCSSNTQILGSCNGGVSEC